MYATRDLLRPAGLLTIARIPLGFAFLQWSPNRPVALAILGLAALSDALDGTVARYRHEQSDAGAIADPIADKVFAGCVVFALLRDGALDPRGAVALLTREIGLALLLAYVFVRGHRGPARALPLGKVATVMQFSAVIALVAQLPVATALLGATAVFGALAAGCYWDREISARR